MRDDEWGMDDAWAMMYLYKRWEMMEDDMIEELVSLVLVWQCDDDRAWEATQETSRTCFARELRVNYPSNPTFEVTCPQDWLARSVVESQSQL